MIYKLLNDTYDSLDDFEKAVLCLNRKNFPTILKTYPRIVRNSLDRFIETRFIVDLAAFDTKTSFILDLKDMEDLFIHKYGFPLSVVSDLKKIYLQSNQLLDTHINSKEFYLPEEFYYEDFYN